MLGKEKLIRNFYSLLFILSISFGFTPLYASVYDDEVLNIYSKILPRMVLMSNKKNKFKDKIAICIVHDKIDVRAAESLKEKIFSEYPEGIKNYKIKMTDTIYADIESCHDAQMVFLFDSSESNIIKATEFSNKNAIISMSYNAKYLENGVGLSLFLGRKVVPYINMSAFRTTGIELDNVLLRVSKIYSEGEQ
jgi:hypothetical protein